MEAPALRGIFTISRILGAFPFDSEFHLSKKLMANGIFIQTVIVMGIADIFFFQVPPPMEKSKSAKDVWIFFAIFDLSIVQGLIVNVFAMFWWVVKQDNVHLLFDSINQIASRCNKCPKRRFRFSHVILISCSFLFIVSDYNVPLKYLFQHMRSNFALFLSVSSTLTIVGHLWDLQHLLTIVFKDTVKHYDENSVHSFEKFDFYIELINDIYGPTVFLIIMQSFMGIVHNLYALFLPLFPGLILVNALMLGWTVLRIVQTISIIHSFSNIKYELKKYNEELYFRVVNDKTTSYLENEVFNFHFLAYKETDFSAGGFFNVDYPLVCSLISAATTYLVIALDYGRG